jgi:hypothetical protein
MRARTLVLIACIVPCAAATAVMIASGDDDDRSRAFSFTPLTTSAACVPGGAGVFPNERPFVLPPGFTQFVFAREGDGGAPDNWDMNTQNESGPQAGRFLYRTHETPTNGAVTVTDLTTGVTRVLVQRIDWNRMDGIVWTPWGTILADEEMRPERLPSLPDPTVPQALAGLVYEINPRTGAAVARPALGAKAHEGIRFDSRGNIYSISETGPGTMVGTPPRSAPGGYIFKFTPDRRGDLSSGQLYALKIVRLTGDRTGDAIWVPLDRALVQVDADMAATDVGATGYGRPEDVETATSTGNDRNRGENLYVAVTDESRVLRIELRSGRDGRDEDDHDGHDDENNRNGSRSRGRDGGSNTAFVSDYVRRGVNAPMDFTNPDNLALDKAGNLYITEDTTTPPGMDLWVALPPRERQRAAEDTVRFASLTDCAAEPSGIYFDLSGKFLFVNVLHRGGPDPRDLGVIITQDRRRR